MCKVLLIFFVVLRVSLADELLSRDDPDVVKYVAEGWTRLVARNETKGARNLPSSKKIYCPRMLVDEGVKKYTILVEYHPENSTEDLVCVIYAWKEKGNPYSIKCYHGSKDVEPDWTKKLIYDLFHFHYDDNFNCPKDNSEERG